MTPLAGPDSRGRRRRSRGSGWAQTSASAGSRSGGNPCRSGFPATTVAPVRAADRGAARGRGPSLARHRGACRSISMTEHPIAVVERHILDRAHRAVEHVLARLDVAAEMAGTMGGPELSGLVRDLLDSVDATLLPHMAWEEQVCFPETDRLAGTPWATRILYLQHEQNSAPPGRSPGRPRRTSRRARRAPSRSPAGAVVRAPRDPGLAPGTGGARPADRARHGARRDRPPGWLSLDRVGCPPLALRARAWTAADAYNSRNVTACP